MIKELPCQTCKHIQKKGPRTGLCCAAFPEGIPIFVGDFDHRQAFEGDNGIRYEARDATLDYWKELDDAMAAP